MCQCEPIIRLTPEGERLNKILKVLFFVYLILIILKGVSGDFSGLFSDILVLLLLLITFLQCNYFFAGLLIFFLLFDVIHCLMFIGLRIQNKVVGLKDKYLELGFYTFALVVQCISLVFYIVLIVFSFKSYKEFKAISKGFGGYCKSTVLTL